MSDKRLKNKYGVKKLVEKIDYLINYTINSVNQVINDSCLDKSYHSLYILFSNNYLYQNLSMYKIINADKIFPIFNFTNYLKSNYHSFMNEKMLKNLSNINIIINDKFFQKLPKIINKVAGPFILYNLLAYYTPEETNDSIFFNQFSKMINKIEIIEVNFIIFCTFFY